MQIILVAPLVSPIRVDGIPLGGAQTFLAELARGLAARGEQVTLLAADGSAVPGVHTPMLGIESGRLRAARFDEPARRTDTREQQLAFQIVRESIQRSGRGADIIHAHAFDAPAFEQLDFTRPKVVHTLHLPPVDPDVVKAARRSAPTASLTAVSHSSADAWRESDVPIRAVIHAGIDINELPFSTSPGRYLLFAGRITPEKGPDHAIRLAKAAGLPLVLAGDIYDRDFFTDRIEPMVAQVPEFRAGSEPQAPATYIGPRTRAALMELMASASAVLMPAQWEEPFGLVGLEAQATGTPVVAYRRGGLAEVVEHGVSGWLVEPDDERGFEDAIAHISTLDRAACRASVASRFGRDRMLDAYLDLYRELRSNQ
jgi:glycosyltransferase involved in cell wall biosynthesis